MTNEFFPRAAEFRAAASEALRGSWGKAAVCSLIVFLVTIAIALLNGDGTSPLRSLLYFVALLLVAVPLEFGYSVAFLRHVRGEDNAELVTRPFQAFRQYGRYLGTSLFMTLILYLWALICIPFVFAGVVIALVAGYGDEFGTFAGNMDAVNNMGSEEAMAFGGFFLIIMLFALVGLIPCFIMGYAYRLTPFIMHDNPELSATECVSRSRKMMNGYKWKAFCLDFSFIGWLLLCVLTFGILALWVAPRMTCAQAKFYEELMARQEAE